jgi:hypothetical protein
MQSFVSSLKQIVSVGAALALLLMVGPASPKPAVAGEMGYGGHHGGGHSGGGGGIGGVGVGIGVGSIILNEAIRRSQERQAAEPRGCPEGLVPSRHGCVKPGKDRGPREPEISKCEPPMQWHKGKGCVPAKGPDVARCEPPMQYHKGKGCVPAKEPEVAKCEHGHGKGCEQPPEKTVSCDRPFVKNGRECICPPGSVQHGHDCERPPVVVIEPPRVVPVWPIPEGPPHVVPAGPAPEGPPHAAPPPPPPPPQTASPAHPAEQPKPVPPVAKVEPASLRCLPDDLYDLLEQTYGKRPAVGRCPAACLPKPASFTPAELDAAAAKSGINWCDNCVQVGGFMPLASVLKLEKAANLTICVNPDMCRLPASIGGGNAGDHVVEIRTVFRDLPAGAKNEGNIAVVVGNHDYQGDLPDNPDGTADADAVMALLIDQLGYKQENIIDLRDATLADLERVFGSDNNPEGELAKRIDKKNPGDVFIYIASHGMVKEDDGKQVYLLPVDAKLDDLDKTAYPLQGLYEHLGKIGARTIMLMLEANFAKNLDELIDPPNLPELEVEAMPVNPVPGLAVFKASDRDQKTIQDPEYSIGLFTRYLIEGLAGRADEAPLGNDDKRIDTVELYVYTADAVRTAARKSFGLEQKPLLSKIDNLVVGNLTSN